MSVGGRRGGEDRRMRRGKLGGGAIWQRRQSEIRTADSAKEKRELDGEADNEDVYA